MAQLLFVCTGNICRSAYAERYARLVAGRLGDAEWDFASAGVAAVVGAGMSEPMVRELAVRGGSAGGFASRQLSGALALQADLILAMEVYHRQVLLADHPALVRRTFTLGQLRRMLEGIADLRGRALLEAVGARRQQARPEDDVPDPYRRGQAAAHLAATQISDALDALLPRLLQA